MFKANENVNDVALVFLLFTLNIFYTFSSVYIVDFERVNVSWTGNQFSRFSSVMTFNPFLTNVPKLYPLKTPENQKVFWCFGRYEMGTLEQRWVNIRLVGLQYSLATYLPWVIYTYIFINTNIKKVCSLKYFDLYLWKFQAADLNNTRSRWVFI